VIGKDNFITLQYHVRLAWLRDSVCEKWFWAQELRWRKFIGNLRRRMSRFKNREVAGVVYIALGLNYSPNICRFCSWWTLQNVWNPKAVRLAVTKSIQRRVLHAASWEGIQTCCHTALPNFPTISREKISLDRIPIFWFTLSFGEFESGNRYYNHKRKKEKNIDYTNDVDYWRWKRKWGRHSLKRLQ